MKQVQGITDAPDFGSGIFGQWVQDENGLPAYCYTMRYDDPRCLWNPSPLPPSVMHWHQLGNDRLNANAYNLGMVKVFNGESGALWLNEYAPEKGKHAGGFGWLIADESVLVDRDDCIPADATWERVFGIGYYLKRLSIAGLIYQRRVFAPTGDLPFLVSEVTVRNTTDAPREVALIEYWDVNMRLLKDFLLGRGIKDRFRDSRVRLVLDADRSLLSAVPRRIFGSTGGFPPRPVCVDPELPAVFLACLDGAPSAWITNPAVLFTNDKPRLAPAGVLAHSGAYAFEPGSQAQDTVCLAARQTFTLAPCSERTMHFLYGYAKGEDPGKMIATAVSEKDFLWEKTVACWKTTAPSLCVEKDSFLCRELIWDYYSFTSSSLYNAYYQCHYIPQGGNYLYVNGGNGATRDFAAFVQTLTYYRTKAAREMLEFMMCAQEEDGRLFYDLEGHGKRYTLPYRPSDLDLWFLWSLCEYVFATRDFAFLNTIVPYYPLHKGKRGTIWEHAQRSLYHLINRVSTGPHGHIRLRLSDWNDEMTWLTAGSNPLDMLMTFARGESVMNTAMACYILPMVRDLASTRGDHETVKAAEAFLKKMRCALPLAWSVDHLIRSYSGLGRPYGDTVTYLEPLVWALLAEGVLDAEKEKIIVRTIIERLKQPSSLGLMISDSTQGSLTTRRGEQEEGGIWYAIDGPAAIALSRFDLDLAWDELVRNTLAWHAHVYPSLWYGIWSGPDAWNGPSSNRPGQTWYQETPVMDIGPQSYPVQNAHAHCQTMYTIARLAGITPTAEGWTIIPRIPMARYAFSCHLFVLEVEPGRISGAVNLPVTAELPLKVKIPAGWTNPEVTVDGRRVHAVCSNDRVEFMIKAQAERKTKWEIVNIGRQGGDENPHNTFSTYSEVK